MKFSCVLSLFDNIITLYTLLSLQFKALVIIILLPAFRFLAMPLLVRAYEKAPGPASITFFRVEQSDQGLDPVLDYPSSLRNELSLAHSELFFFKPHALVLSLIEDRDILDYFDPVKYQRACQIYPNNTCPLDDLDRCFVANHHSWAQLYRNRGLIN